MGKRLVITAADPLPKQRLRVLFSDGMSGEVDLSDRLRGPMFEPLKDPEFFKQVRVDGPSGTVMWPNGADIAPDVIHEELSVSPRRQLVASAARKKTTARKTAARRSASRKRST